MVQQGYSFFCLVKGGGGVTTTTEKDRYVCVQQIILETSFEWLCMLFEYINGIFQKQTPGWKTENWTDAINFQIMSLMF